MQTVIEAGRSTPVLAETEVLVVEGGPAGLAAAQSIEDNTTPGMSTSAKCKRPWRNRAS